MCLAILEHRQYMALVPREGKQARCLIITLAFSWETISGPIWKGNISIWKGKSNRTERSQRKTQGLNDLRRQRLGVDRIYKAKEPQRKLQRSSSLAICLGVLLILCPHNKLYIYGVKLQG